MAPPAPAVLPSACPLDCPDACSLEVHVAGGKVEFLDGTSRNPVTAGFICRKVRDFARHVHGPERVLHPAIRSGSKGSGEFRRASWDEALELVARKLAEAKQRFGGESILPLYYGGSNGNLTQDSTDARLFRRLGASRLARTVCAAPTGRAAAGLYGKMPGVALDDYVHARLIVVWGCNPAASGIHLVPFIKQAQEAGAQLVVLDPRRTSLAKAADLHLALRPGTDLPVALALVRELFQSGAADEEFLAQHATGAQELRRRAAQWTMERAAETADVPVAGLQAFARLYAESSPAVIRCGWGLERNRNGGSAAAAVLALPAVAGKFGLRGGGFTMSNAHAIRLDSDAAAREPAADRRTVNMNRTGRALLEYKDPPIKLLFVYNSNPLATLPDQRRVRAGLAREDLFTVVFDQVRTDTARYADVLLPATTFLEHAEMRSGYGAMALQFATPVIPPVGESRPNYEVFAELCRRLGLARPDDPETAAELLAALCEAHPRGAGLAAQLEKDRIAFPDEGPNPVQFQDLFPRTPDRNVHLVPPELDQETPRGLYHYQEDPATERFPLALISPATSKTISSTLGQLVPGPVAMALHPQDARARGLLETHTVRVFNDLGEVRCPLTVSDDLRPGTAFLPKGIWERHTLNGNTSNALVPDTYADLGGGACFNDARVQVERCDS